MDDGQEKLAESSTPDTDLEAADLEQKGFASKVDA